MPLNPGIASGSFHSLLRQETESRHRALENTALSARLLSPGVTLRDYLFYLSAFSGIARWYDVQVLPLVTDTLDDISERRKLRLILSDLEALENIGYPAPSYPPFQAPAPRDKAEAMGACYVLEGSTLGGRVILKHILPILPPALSRGDAFSQVTEMPQLQNGNISWRNWRISPPCIRPTPSSVERGLHSI